MTYAGYAILAILALRGVYGFVQDYKNHKS